MKRTPNNYDTSVTTTNNAVVAVEDDELTSFLAGQSTDMSIQAKDRVNLAMQNTRNKIDIFLGASAQKDMLSTARLMQALDTTEKALFQDWRISAMDTDQLMDLQKQLHMEKHKSLGHLVDLSDKFKEDDLEQSLIKALPGKAIEEVQDTKLTLKSRRKITKFFKKITDNQ